MLEILSFIKAKSVKFNSSHEDFMTLINKAKNPGLLINERIINLPFECGMVLHQEVSKDIEWVL